MERHRELFAALADEEELTAEHFLGVSIRAVREERDMSQEELARRMEDYGFSWTKNTVWKTETARRPIRVNEVVAIAEILGVHAAALIGDARDNWTYRADVLRAAARVRRLGERIAETERTVTAIEQEYRDAVIELERLRSVQGRTEGFPRWRPVLLPSGNERRRYHEQLKQVELIWAMHDEGMPAEDIADALGGPLGEVEKILDAARFRR